MHNQHTGLSQVLAEQRITERQQEAVHARLRRAPRPLRPQRRSWAAHWWRLVRQSDVATAQLVGRPPNGS